MKVLLLGTKGQLGKSLFNLFKKKNIIFSYYDKSLKKNYVNYNTTNIKKIIFTEKPNLVVNAIAFTNVDQAQIKKKICYKVNVIAVKKIALACKKINAKLIHFSTDYVYGEHKNFFINESNKKKPTNYYSRTKLISENVIKKIKCNYIIFRIAWVYNINRDNNFIKKIINKILIKKDFTVVNDQFGHPTSTDFISDFISTNLFKIYKSLNKKTYNLCPSGYASRYYIANFILNYMIRNNLIIKKDIKIIELKTKKLNKLPRQLNSVLSNLKIKKDFKVNFYDWKFYLKKTLNKYYATE